MGCTYCGKEIGSLRLLRDNEFCTSKHRKLYHRDRLNRVLGEGLTHELPPASAAGFITELSARECRPHAFADLAPRGWVVGNQPVEWHFPLTIDPVVTHLPKRLPSQAADRPAAPRMADLDSEIAPPVPPAMPLTAPALPELPGIPYPAMAAQSNWIVGLQAEPAIGKMLPAGAAAPSFSVAAPRLPAYLTLEPNSALALAIDCRAKLLPLQAADRPAAIWAGDREIASPISPSLQLTASALPGIPHPAMAAQSNWSVGLQTEPAMGELLPSGAASPSFFAAAQRLPACLTLESNSTLALAIDSRAKILPLQAADRAAAPRMADQEIASTIPPSLQVTASALPGIPHPAMAAQANWSVGLQAEPAIGKTLPAAAASPSFSAAAQRLPACLTLESNSPLALAIDGRLQLLPLQASDRPAAPRMAEQEIAPTIPPSLQVTASALPGIPHPAMAAQANWSVGLQAEPAMGQLSPAAAASPSFSAAAPHLPACLTLESNSPLGLAIDGRLQLLPLQASDRPAAPRMAEQEIAPTIPPSLQVTASALPGIPHPAMAAQANWSDGLQAEPAIGEMLPAGAAAPSFSVAAPRLPVCLTLASNSPLALVIDSRAKTLPLQAADRAAAPRMAEQEIAPTSPSLQLTAPALPGIPHPAMAAQASFSDGLHAEPAMGKLFPAVPAPVFSNTAPRLPAFLTLCWDSPLVLGPVIDSRLQLLPFHAADRPAALRAGVREIAPPMSHLLQFTASALPGIPDTAIPAQANWSDGRRAEPAMGKMGPAAGAPPSFSAAAPRLPAFLTLEPVQAVQSQEPPPAADFIPLEYYCATATSGPSATLEWKWRSPACALLPFGLHLAGEKLVGPAAVKKPVVPFPAPAAAAVAKKTKWEGRVIQLAAAAVLLVALTGFGMRFTAGAGTGTADVKPTAVAAYEPSVQSGGPIESIRRAIATRAKVELNDTFDRGMQAWGHAASWAPGWSHHAEGYVQTGQLALFQPSMKFTDYKMEFFGQIESKSIGWVVRAQDPKNYYAMKFTVIQSGLRPIIAMVHYPVTGGHAGRPIETPLMDVMVHNNTPYHVAVTVAGNRIITSIEGQEVDRWIEDQIPSGGVGFYSDAGERARLYWMKVSKNEDFLGKVCAYLSGSPDASRVFATLLPPLLPPRWNYDKR